MSNERATIQRVSPWASGPILFAGGMLVIAGLMQVFIGTAALVHDKFSMAHLSTCSRSTSPCGAGLNC